MSAALESAVQPRLARNASRVSRYIATVAGCSTNTCTNPRPASAIIKPESTETATTLMRRSRTKWPSATKANIADSQVPARNMLPDSPSSPCHTITGVGNNASSTNPVRIPRPARTSPKSASALARSSTRSSACENACPTASNAIASTAGSTSNQTRGSINTIARNTATPKIPASPAIRSDCARFMRAAPNAATSADPQHAQRWSRAPASPERSRTAAVQPARLATDASAQVRCRSLP